MSPVAILAALAFLLAYGVLCFYFGVRSSWQDFETKLERARALRFQHRGGDEAW